MKHIIFTMLTAGAVIILTLDSCKKETYAPVAPGSGFLVTSPFALDLVANHWVNYANEIYIDEFNGILAPLTSHTNGNVSVFLVTGDKQIQIDHTVILFMGNQLWATTTSTDLKINYRCANAKLPFTSLNIRVALR